MLYEVAILQTPTENEQKEGKGEVLILPPTPVVATNDRAAGVKAVLDNKDKITADLSRVNVLVRPFA
jgi:hypothetical protein